MGWLDEKDPNHVAHVSFRLLQIFGGILALAFYLTDLMGTTKSMKFNYSLWMYASIVPITSVVVALAYVIPKLTNIRFLFVLDTLIFANWTVVSAMFVKLYMVEAQAAATDRLSKMYLAMWCDVVNGGLWFISAVGMFIHWRKHEWVGKAAMYQQEDF